MATRDPYQDEATMRGAVERQRASANRIAEEWLKANAMERALAQGAAQWLAWKEWATGWQAAAVQAEIANKYAPQRSTIESQRQQALAAAAEQEFAIPTQMAGIRNQEVENEYNRSLIKKPWTTYGSWSSWDKDKPKYTWGIFDSIKGLMPLENIKKLYGDNWFQMWQFVWTKEDWDGLTNEQRIDSLNLQMKRNREATPWGSYSINPDTTDTVLPYTL